MPAPPRGGDISAPLFVGEDLFLTVKPKRPSVRQLVLKAARVGSALCNSAKVASGFTVSRATNRCSW